MTDEILPSIPERLAKNTFMTADGHAHLEIDQEIARRTGTGKLLTRVCPAHVYTEEADGTISAEIAACMECGTCIAVAAPGALRWVYPDGGMGIAFREG